MEDRTKHTGNPGNVGLMISRRTLLSMLPPLAAMPLLAGRPCGAQSLPDIAHPFSADSAWNTPIDPAHITYTDPTAIENQQFRDQALANTWIQQVDNLLFITPPDTPLTLWNFDPGKHAVYSTVASAPLKLWRYDTLNNGGVFSTGGEMLIPTPPALGPTLEFADWSMFTELDGVHLWETWAAEVLSDGTFHVPYLCHVDLTGTGWGKQATLTGVGIRAAGASLLGGLIPAAELAGVPLIEHAVPIELDDAQLKAGTVQTDQFVPPAVSCDGDSLTTYTGTIPMGAHFALPPDVVLPSTLTPEGLALAKAYQKYGGYVVDAAGFTCALALVTDISEQQSNALYLDTFWIRDNLVMTLPR
jgi:hypothetical protein